MIGDIGNHLWQSTAVALVAVLLTSFMRNNRARLRYWLYLAASLKFLVPFSLLTAMGNQIEWRTAAPVALATVSTRMEQISQPFSSGMAAADQHFSWQPILLAAWALGAVVIMLYWCRSWLRIHSTLLHARLTDDRRELPILVSPSTVEPGVFGLFRQVLLLPESIADLMEREHLDAIMVHELCHARHYDNLAAAIHMLVEALFWFHPLVWWLGKRMVEERELACDEEVLHQGKQREIYAESILRTCRFYVAAPIECVSGVTGADLKDRILRIMTQPAPQRVALTKKVLLAFSGVLILASPLVFGVLNAAPRQTGVQSSSVANPAQFDAVSIKPDNGDGMRMRIAVGLEPNGHLRANGVPLKMLLEMAYGVKDSQILDAPAWINEDRFQIEAKADDATAQRMAKATQEERQQIMSQMLQAMLADRCQLKLRTGTKELQVYSLGVTKNGPKLKESAPEPPDGQAQGLNGPGPVTPGPGGPMRRGGIMMGRGQMDVTAVSMDAFADVLSRQLGKPVVDNTGLKGKYDFSLKWTPSDEERQGFRVPGSTDAPPPPDPSGPSIFTALQEQLGLKLDSQKSPMAVLIIDHIEKPSAN